MNPLIDSSRSCSSRATSGSPHLRTILPTAVVVLLASSLRLVGQSTASEVVQLEAVSVDAVDLNQVLPEGSIDSLFGPDLKPLNVPSSVSDGIIERYGIRSTRDMIAVVPGTFTPSNYGIDGGLRIRGEDGEVYFRGFRKLQNSALFPTPLGATQQVDVVRGPASAVFGPSRNSSFLNSSPNQPAPNTSKLRPSPSVASLPRQGSYDYYKGSIEYGTPIELEDRAGSYFFYSETVDADSFYENDYDQSWLAQESLELDLTKKLTLQAGFMYYDWEGKNNISWNRVAQELIDDGIYTTGQPPDINSYDGDIEIGLTPSDFSIASGAGP
ncbi:MAG: TonB-dependent receptor plug domain-containing protein [Candidatus Synoicihabitans palmerolidicus]|nr:TonB-dependent receptor plug domain-containing protein [Candidatus Synoicihabitans palmerolidicus]